MNKCLTTCPGCCRFDKEDVYFAPKFTKEEFERIKSNGFNKDFFKTFKNSKNVFQISLIKSKLFKDIFICPFYDEVTRICEIYKIRPFDCEFWPFMVMYDENKEKVFIAHYNKDVCPITDDMSETQFKEYLEKTLDKWIKEKDLINLIKEHPDLIWDYELETFMIKEISLF